jgi:hypothetical protein
MWPRSKSNGKIKKEKARDITSNSLVFYSQQSKKENKKKTGTVLVQNWKKQEKMLKEKIRKMELLLLQKNGAENVNSINGDEEIMGEDDSIIGDDQENIGEETIIREDDATIEDNSDSVQGTALSYNSPEFKGLPAGQKNRLQLARRERAASLLKANREEKRRQKEDEEDGDYSDGKSVDQHIF